jgi:hypothetical protein
MATANSSAREARPSKDDILRALERLASEAKAVANGTSIATRPQGPPKSDRPSALKRPVPIRRASGIFRSVDEYAGLERLDREELDETDGA